MRRHGRPGVKGPAYSFAVCLAFLLLSSCDSSRAKLKEARRAIEASDTATAEKLLREIADSDCERIVNAEAQFRLSGIYAGSSRPQDAREALEKASELGHNVACTQAVDYYLNGNSEYGFDQSDAKALALMEQIRSANPGQAFFPFNDKLVELYIFSPECRNPLKAADIVSAQNCPHWDEYRSVLRYMGSGGIPQDIGGASALLQSEPLPETAAHMGHLALLQLLCDGDFPEQKVMLALKYYNIALRESKYADSEALTRICRLLNSFLDKFNSRSVSTGFFQLHKRNISGGWGEYDNNGFNYCGALAGGYPNGFGVGSTDNERVYCGNWKNGIYAGEGVLMDKNGDIRVGDWGPKEMRSGIYISHKGEISKF